MSNPESNGLSLPLVVSSTAHVVHRRCYVICVCLNIVVSNTYCAVFCFACLCLVHQMLPVSLNFTFLIAPSVFSNIYFEQIYHAWEGYLRKIPVERRKIFRAEWRGKFSLKTGIFRKYPSQT
jgi:hypothetical protein